MERPHAEVQLNRGRFKGRLRLLGPPGYRGDPFMIAWFQYQEAKSPSR